MLLLIQLNLYNQFYTNDVPKVTIVIIVFKFNF